MSNIVEEQLIAQVRANPILYDLKNRQYRNPVLRKETWDKIGESLDRSGEYCKETWNKLRNAYTNALNRRKSKNDQICRKMAKWVYEDQMSFLPVSIGGTRPGPRKKEELQEQPNDTIFCDNDDDDDDDNHCHDVKPASSPVLTVNEALSTDHSDIAATHFHTCNPNECSHPKRESKVQISKLENTMNELVTVVKNNTQMISNHYKSHQNQSVFSPNCSHDEDEMYFLSLARYVKKLSPAERIRVKSEVSQTIFQAEYRNLKNEEQQQTPHFLSSTLSQHATSEQYFSETTIADLKTEKE